MSRFSLSEALIDDFALGGEANHLFVLIYRFTGEDGVKTLCWRREQSAVVKLDRAQEYMFQELGRNKLEILLKGLRLREDIFDLLLSFLGDLELIQDFLCVGDL